MREVGIKRGSAHKPSAGVNDGPPLLQALRVFRGIVKRDGHQKTQHYHYFAVAYKNTLR
jgi:hypothetical protein